VNPPGRPPRIVIGGLQQLDSTWYVDLSEDRSILTKDATPYAPINNATVTITGDDGSSVTLSKVGYSRYKHESNFPTPGRHYKLVASAPGYSTVEAEMTMPPIVPIIDIEWDSTNVPTAPPSNFYSQYNIPFKVKFQDPSGTKNFYTVYVHVYGEAFRFDPVTGEKIVQKFRTTSAVWIIDPAIAEEDEFIPIWRDESFDGQMYTANLETRFNRQPNQTTHRVEVFLFNVSEDYYRYFETLRVARNVEGDPFAQPVQVYSNVNEGLGIFAGHSADVVIYERNN
jgi:hypothetical protein